MGFLLVCFPADEDEDEDEDEHEQKPKPKFLSSIKPTNSWPNFLHKAQSTISICLILLLFTTILLFTLSPPPTAAPRRRLRESLPVPPSTLPHALQGMGTLYRRGTGAVNDVVLAQAHGSLSPSDLKLFLRLFLRSGLASESDLVLIFPAKNARLDGLILRELKSFVELLNRYGSSSDSSLSTSGFDVTHFTSKKRESGEPIWGQKTRTNLTETGNSNRPSYGSVVGFDADELDPENSLSGFLDHVPMSLRRWACYPMLLGRVRRNYKHVALVDIKDILLLGDPLLRVRNRSPESVLLNSATTQLNPSQHGKKNSDKSESTQGNPVLHPGIVMGGVRGVRRLSSAMLTDIVRGSMIRHKKRKSPFTESVIFNQLVENGYALKNVNLIVSTESLPEPDRKSGSQLFTMKYGLIKRGRSSNMDVIHSMVMKHICSFPIDSTVYSDCM